MQNEMKKIKQKELRREMGEEEKVRGENTDLSMLLSVSLCMCVCLCVFMCVALLSLSLSSSLPACLPPCTPARPPVALSFSLRQYFS